MLTNSRSVCRVMRRAARLAILCVMAVGCLEAPPKAWMLKDRGASTPFRDQQVIGGVEMLDDLEVGGTNGAVDLNLREDRSMPSADAFVSYGAPLAAQVAVIADRARAWTAHVRDDHVRYASRHRDDDSAVLSSTRWFSLPVDTASSEVTLRPVHANHPRLLFMRGASQSAQLYHFTAPDSPPLDLELTPPIYMASHEGEVLFWGRIPDEMGWGWRWLIDDALTPVIKDDRGLSEVASVGYALERWFISTPEGQCAHLSAGGIGLSWRCHSQAGSRSVGSLNDLSFIGEIPRSSPLFASDDTRGFWTWVGAPGVAVNPYLDKEDEYRFRALSGRGDESTQEWIGEGIVWRVDSIEVADEEPNIEVDIGLMDSEVMDSEVIDSGVMDSEVMDSGVMDSGVMDSDVTDGGVVTERHSTLWALREPSGHLESTLLPDEEGGYGLIDWGATSFWVIWSGEELTLSPLESWEDHGGVAQVAQEELCLFSPERCDSTDHDCDGRARGGLCCRLQDSDWAGTNFSVALPEVNALHSDWSVVDSDIGMLVMLAHSQRAELFSLPFEGGSPQLRAQWNQIQSLGIIGHFYSIVSMHATDTEGQSVLLWNLYDATLDAFIQRPSPCEAPLAITVLNTEHLTRVYCPEASFLIHPLTNESTRESYPLGAQLSWMTRWHPSSASVNERLFLVAQGAESRLSIWRDDPTLGVITDPTEVGHTLPLELSQLSTEDRQRPVHLSPIDGGWISRVSEARQLEVWVPLRGWTSALSSPWPHDVQISTFAPLALSLAFSSAPPEGEELDLTTLRYDLYYHTLSPSASFWGVQYIENSTLSYPKFAKFQDLGGARPNLLTLTLGGVLGGGYSECISR